MLKRTLTEDEFQELPEAIREDYTSTETDDGTTYDLQVDGMVSDGDVEGLRSALEKERSNVDEQKRKRKELEGLKIAVEERMATLQTEKDAEVTSLTEQLSLTENQEKGKRENLLRKMADVLRDKAAIDAIVVHHGDPKFLLPILQKELTATIDEDGTSRVAAKAKSDDGKPLTAHELVAKMRKDPAYASVFRGTGSSGGGMLPTSGSKFPQSATPRRNSMTPRQKVDFIKENGNEAYQALPM